MTVADDGKLDAASVAELYTEHAAELRRFLQGVLRDSQLADDVLQIAFTKMVTEGHKTQTESRKAWLFRVALHEAFAVRRRQHVQQRVLQRSVWQTVETGDEADTRLLQQETIEAVQSALKRLPAEQQHVVLQRIYDNKTFAQIACESQVPLGTVLWRMQAALKKLRSYLRESDTQL